MQPHDLTTTRLQNFGNIHSTILHLNTAQRPTAIILSMYLLSTHPQQQKWLYKRCTKVIVHFEWLWCIMRQHKVVCIAFLWKSESTLLCKAVTKLSVLTFLSYEVSKRVEIYHKLKCTFPLFSCTCGLLRPIFSADLRTLIWNFSVF